MAHKQYKDLFITYKDYIGLGDGIPEKKEEVKVEIEEEKKSSLIEAQEEQIDTQPNKDVLPELPKTLDKQDEFSMALHYEEANKLKGYYEYMPSKLMEEEKVQTTKWNEQDLINWMPDENEDVNLEELESDFDSIMLLFGNLTKRDRIDPKDFECFICYNVMVEPRLLLCCNHRICSQCLRKVRRVYANQTSKCPMCTQPMKVSANEIDTDFQKEIMLSMPEDYKEMEEKLKNASLLLEQDNTQVEVELEIGNHYKLLNKFKIEKRKEFKHQFTCFVRVKQPNTHGIKISDIVNTVEYTPYHTF